MDERPLGPTLRQRIPAFTELHTVASQAEARELASVPTRISIIERGVPRSVVFRCPCGCGDVLSINVDQDAGAAWYVRVREGRITLMPSVWRENGCQSHFILWNNLVWWCTSDDEDWPDELDEELRAEWKRIRTWRRTHRLHER